MNSSSHAGAPQLRNEPPAVLNALTVATGEKIAVPFSHSIYARSILDCLNSLGVSPSTVLAQSGLAWQDLRDGKLIDASVFQKFVAQAIKSSGDSALGLRAGLMVQPYHSLLGIGAVTAETLEQSLRFLSRHANLLFGSVEFQLEQGPHWSVLKVKPTRAMGEMRAFITQFIFGAHCRLLEAALGRRVDELVVGLPGLESRDADIPYANYVRRVEWGHEHLTFLMPARCMRERCVSANASEFLEVEQICLRMEKELCHGEFARKVQRALLDRLAHDPDAQQLASTLGVSAQTMARRLAAVGTKYSDLKSDVRKSQATWYLQHTEMSIEDIASELGYSDTTNFSRAFKRWHRMNPRTMRKSLGSGIPALSR
jgi:AraC-like DNA-binding protein